MHMTTIPLAFALAAAPAISEGFEAAAQSAPLKLRPKAAIVTGVAPPRSPAPFVSAVREPELELVTRPHDDRAEARGWSCSGSNALCYDPASGRVVYKPARNYMPDIPGFTRENISVKRDRVVLRYSF
jgi:hypothetical protein